MKPRILILPVAAAVIAALVAWRLNRDTPLKGAVDSTTANRRLAPRFELYDRHSQLVKFERYLGRTRLLLLFIGEENPAEHPLVRLLLERHAEIEAAGVQAVVVGTATPFANRQAEEQLGRSFPFPVLTDVDMRSPEPVPTHRQWGLAGDDPADIREGLFLIDRDGTVNWTGTAPDPVADPETTIESITRGEWPE